MSITSILRNFDGEPNLVTIVSDDTLSAITTAGYLTGAVILAQIQALQNGDFEWAVTDLVLIYYSGGIGFFTHDATNNTFVALAAPGGLSPTLSNGDIFVGNASNVATGVAMSGDGTISNAGVFAISPGVIVNADVNTAAAIAFSKLAALPSAQILVGSAGNVATATAVTGDVTVSNTGVTAIGAGKVLLAMLGTGIAPSHIIKFGGTQANGGGSATIAITVTGTLTSDLPFVQIQASTNAVTVQKVTPTANTVTVLLSGDPGAGTVLSYQVLRAAS